MKDERPETYQEQLNRKYPSPEATREAEANQAAEDSALLKAVPKIATVLLFLDGVVFWLFLGAVLFGDRPWSFLVWPCLAAGGIVILAVIAAVILGAWHGMNKK
jgi:uncharacterized membrane protein SirB2